MKTMQEMWRDYHDRVYPNGIPADQNKEVHQAFFAGALCYMQLCADLSFLPDDDAVKALDDLQSDVLEIAKHRVHTSGARN